MTTQTILGCLRIIEDHCPSGLTQIALYGPGNPQILALIEEEFAFSGLIGWYVYLDDGPEVFDTRNKALGFAIRTISERLI